MEIHFLDETFNTALQPVDEVESMVWTRRYFGCGSFEAKLARGVPFDGNRIKYVYNPFAREAAFIERIKYSDGSFTISGRSLESLLERRIVLGSGVMTGDAEDIARHMVSVNAISLRTIPGLFLESKTGAGVNGTIPYGWEPLSDWLYSSLKPYGLSYRINLYEAESRLGFSVFSGLDRTLDQRENEVAVFSDEFENIASVEYERSDADYKNSAYVRSGNGFVYNRRGGETGMDRRETFVSARDVIYNEEEGDDAFKAELDARGEAALRSYSPIISIRGEITSGGGLVYRRDYDLGDICEVKLNNAGIFAKVRITSVDEVYEKGLFRAVPSFGNEEVCLRSFIRREIGKNI